MIKFYFFLCILFTSLSFAEDRRPDKNKLKVMTYNPYFLWDGKAPEECKHQNAIKSLPWFNKPDVAKQHMAEVAEIIKNNNPDIINFIEVESINSLKILNDNFLQGLGYKAYMKDNNKSGVCQDVGILTRIDPITIDRDESRINDSSGKSKGVRKNYYAKFHVNNHKIALIGAHFKAIPSNKSYKEYREIQARIISNRANELRKSGYLPIVLGDFNDFDSKVLDRNNNVSLTNTLKILSGQNTYSKTEDDLFNIAKLINKNDRYTAIFDEDKDGMLESFDPDELSSLDHLLIDKKLIQYIDNAYIDHTSALKKTLDHRAVIVEFNL